MRFWLNQGKFILNFLCGKFAIILIFEQLKRIKLQVLMIIFTIKLSNIILRSILFYLKAIYGIILLI
jgi:hypothetical protein